MAGDNQSLGRAVLELSTDSAQYSSEIDAAKLKALGLGTAFESAEKSLKGLGEATTAYGKNVSSLGDHLKRIETLAQGFSGDRITQQAIQMARAVEQVGGASKLTDRELATVNRTIGDALAKYQALGTQAPKALVNLAAETKALIQTTDKLGQEAAAVKQQYDRFSGAKVADEAHAIAAAVTQLGGASKLTAVEQANVNRTVTEAIAKYKALGQEAPASLRAIQQQTASTGGFFKDLDTQVGATAAGFIGAQAVIGATTAAYHTLSDFITSSIDSYAHAEAAQKKVTAALTATGNATPKVIAQYDALATQFQKTTVYSDDLISEMQALLVEVGGVMPAQMQGALKASTDLASGLGIDLRDATMLVAKAFSGGGDELGRLKAILGDAYVAGRGMDGILAAINAKFGGQAQAEIATYSGKVKQLANDWDNVKEKTGEILVTDPLVAAALQVVQDRVVGGSKAVIDHDHAWSDLLTRLNVFGKDAPNIVARAVRSMEDMVLASNKAAKAAEFNPGNFKPAASHLTAEEIAAAAEAKRAADAKDAAALEAYRKSLDALREKVVPLTAAQRDLAAQGIEVGQSTKQIADGMHVSEEAVKRYTDALKKSKDDSAFLAGANQVLTDAQKRQVDEMELANRSREYEAKTIGLSSAAIDTYISGVKAAMEAKTQEAKNFVEAEEAKAKAATFVPLTSLPGSTFDEGAIGNALSKSRDQTQKYYDDLVALSKAGTDRQIFDIERQRAAKLKAIGDEKDIDDQARADEIDAANAYYDQLGALAVGAAGTEAAQLTEMGIVTRQVLVERAQAAQRLYEYAKTHDYTPEEIAHLKQLAHEAADAASQVAKIWDALVDGLKASTGQLASALENAIVNGGGVGKAFAEYATNVAKDFTAAALAFIPVIGPMLSQFAGPIVEGFKRLFGGPSKAELDGRKVVADMEDQLALTLTAQQKAEAGGVSWKMTVIAVRDAYIAAGHSAEEAEAAVNRLWASSKDGAEAAKKAADEINAVIANSPATLASDAGYKTKEELQAVADKLKSIYDFMDASGKYTADEVADAFKKWQDAAIAAGDASVIAAKETSDAIKKLDDEYKSLADQVAPEAAEADMGEEEKRARARMDQIKEEKKALEEKAKKEADDAKRTADAQKQAHDDANTTIEKGAEDSHQRTQDYYDQHPWDLWYRYSALNQPPPGMSGSPTPGPSPSPSPSPAPAPSPSPTPTPPGPTPIANPNKVGTIRDANGNVIGTTGGTGTPGRYYEHGGLVSYLATGGHPGQPKGTDVVPAWLTPRELVLTEDQQKDLAGWIAARDYAAEARMTALYDHTADDTMPTSTAQGALFAKLDQALSVADAALASFRTVRAGDQAHLSALITERNRITDVRLDAMFSGRADDAVAKADTPSGKLMRELDDALTGANKRLKDFTSATDTAGAAFAKAGSPGLGSAAGAFVQLDNGQWVPRDHPLAQQATSPRVGFDATPSKTVGPLTGLIAERNRISDERIAAIVSGRADQAQPTSTASARAEFIKAGSPGLGSKAGAFVQLQNGQWVPKDSPLYRAEQSAKQKPIAFDATPKTSDTSDPHKVTVFDAFGMPPANPSVTPGAAGLTPGEMALTAAQQQSLSALLGARDKAATERLYALNSGAADKTMPADTEQGALFTKLDRALTMTDAALTSFTAAQVGNQAGLVALITERNRVADARSEALVSGRADKTQPTTTASGKLFHELDDALTAANTRLKDFTSAETASAAFAKAGSPGLGSKAGAFVQLQNGQFVPRDHPLYLAEQSTPRPKAVGNTGRVAFDGPGTDSQIKVLDAFGQPSKSAAPGTGSAAGTFIQLTNGQWVPKDHPQAAAPRVAFDGTPVRTKTFGNTSQPPAAPDQITVHDAFGPAGAGSAAGAFVQLANGQWVPRNHPLYLAEHPATPPRPKHVVTSEVPIDAGGSTRVAPSHQMTLAGGGVVPEYHALGGLAGQLVRFVPKGTDQIPAMLTRHEGIINVSPGMQRLEPEGVTALNTGKPLPLRIIEKLMQPGGRVALAAGLSGLMAMTPATAPATPFALGGMASSGSHAPLAPHAVVHRFLSEGGPVELSGEPTAAVVTAGRDPNRDAPPANVNFDVSITVNGDVTEENATLLSHDVISQLALKLPKEIAHGGRTLTAWQNIPIGRRR